MTRLNEKRLLFIGATSYACDFIRLAKSQGVFTIVTDYYPDAPAKKVADLSFEVSTTDFDAVKKIALDYNVNAVAVGWSDINMTVAQSLCEDLGLPFYANREQIEVTRNKRLFKELCRECGVPIVPEIVVDSNSDTRELDKLTYPLIVKPVDNGASKGVHVCENSIELKKHYLDALEHSYCKDVIIEKFMTKNIVFFYYTIQDGYISLSAMMDKYVKEEISGVIPHFTGFVFPSVYLDGRHLEFHEKITNLIETLKIKNGTLFIETYVNDNGEICAGEMGYRLSGAREYQIIAKENGVNSLQMYLNHAMTGRFDGWDVRALDNPNFKNIYALLVLVLGSGTISQITGLDSVTSIPGVFDFMQLRDVGDTISAKGTADEYFARAYLVGENAEELASRVSMIQQMIEVYDESGNSMLLEVFDPEILIKRYSNRG